MSESPSSHLLTATTGLCALCETKHEADEPHDVNSMAYKFRFHVKHHRWPTWADAIADLDPDAHRAWKHTLQKIGVLPADEL